MTQDKLINRPSKFNSKFEDKINKAIGRIIRRVRESRGYSTEDACVQAGIKLSTMYAIENGTAKIRVEYIYRFADIYGCEPRDFLPNEMELSFTPEQLSAIDSLEKVGMKRENAITVVLNAKTIEVNDRSK